MEREGKNHKDTKNTKNSYSFSLCPLCLCGFLFYSVNSEHPVQSHSRPVSHLFGDRYLVYYMAVAQVIERPEQVFRRDAEHSRAHAEIRSEQPHKTIRVSFLDT